jgi:hypothetical protein
VRLLRQEIAVLCQQPDARKELLRRNLRRALQFYDRFIRQDATQEQIVQIDSLARSAAAAIDRGGKADLDLAKDLVQQIDRLYWMHGFGQINFCIGCFKHHRESRYLATDPAKFDNSVAEGDRALASGDGETVRRVLFDILLDQRNVGPDAHAPEKAWLMRA